MLPNTWLMGCLLAVCGFACRAEAPPVPGVAEIVARNAQARGGAQAWQQLKTMVWTGYVQSGTQPTLHLSFLLEQERPARTRFEIMAEGQKSVRVFSANEGWKIRVSSGGAPEMQPYTVDELKYAQSAPVIVGPLMDFASKGHALKLVGQDTQEDRPAFVLEATTDDGETHRLWVDAQSFVELRWDRSFRNSAGRAVQSTVLYRDYRDFEGLQIPVLVETGTPNGQALNRMVIERVALNPQLAADTFARPALQASRHAGATVVDLRGAAAPGLHTLKQPLARP